MDWVFNRVWERTKKLEGSRFSIDQGGETKFGVCWKWDQAELVSRGYSKPEDIKDLTEEDAKFIYYKKYWIRHKILLLAPLPLTAATVFDMDFHEGKYGWMSMQRAMGDLLGISISVDGVPGPQTIKAISNLIEKAADYPDGFFNDHSIAVIVERWRYYYYRVIFEQEKQSGNNPFFTPMRKLNSGLRRLGQLTL